MKKDYHSSTIQRALDILNLFINHNKLSFTEIQELLEYNKSTLYRVLTMLEGNNYLAKDFNNRYKLGVNIYILGQKFLKENQIKEIAKPYMEEVSKKTNLTTELGIIEGKKVIVLHQIDPPDSSIRLISRAGVVLPAHCTGIGKALLAFSKKEKVMELIKYNGLKSYTPNTITSADKLFTELKETKERGYSINSSEQEKHIKNISVPILNNKGLAEAAIGVTGLTLDFEENEAMDRFSSLLKDVASKIEKEMKNFFI